jgi:hypothetical protein
MRRTLAIAFILTVPTALCAAESLEIIPLLHLNAPDLAAAFAGGGGTSTAELLDQEAAAFALDAMRYAAQQWTGRTSQPQPQAVSRARSAPGGIGDLSGLLPDGLAGPPAAAPNQNALVVRGERKAIDRLREVITLLDVPTPMVNVELMQDEVSTADARRIDPFLRAWGFGGELAAGAPVQPVLSFGVGDLRAGLGFDARSTTRRTMTATNITGMSGQPLLLSVGEIRPRIVGQLYYDAWGNRHLEYYPEAIFVGVTFWVLPTVNADDSVTMVLRPELSEVMGPAARIGINDIVRRTLVATTVRVPDGQSLIIGGLDRRADEITRSFPGSSGEVRTDGSSILSVTPRIIRTLDTGR